MDLNVCSRRVHDGYATIRSRGRSRPRAVYRSDSDEFLKDTGGPYALPRVSNLPLAAEGVHQVPRWTDLDKDRPFENYGTLRGSSKKSQDEPRRVTLNTFSGKRTQGPVPTHGQGTQDDCLVNGQGHARLLRNEERRIEYPVQGRVRQKEDRLYDSVPPKDGVRNQRTILKSFAKSKAVRPEQNGFAKPVLQRQTVLDVAPRKIGDCGGSELKEDGCDGVAEETEPLKKQKTFGKENTRTQNGVAASARKSKKAGQNFSSRGKNMCEKEQGEESMRNDRAIVSPYYAKVPQPEIVQNGFAKLEEQLQTCVADVVDGVSSKHEDTPLLDSDELSPNITVRPRSDAKSRKAADKQPKDKQPVYAVPNVFAKTRRARRVVVVDGNYVPSGDLYRTTAKYIEDINRNIAEIDKSYEELKSTSGSQASAYGVINKIAKGPALDPSASTYTYHRKMDMAPMPPISPNFGQSPDERHDLPADPPPSSAPRPNSYGRLPPKLLPRSSSIENTSRHSTGSTTSSTRSTESLYAISETFAEPKASADQRRAPQHHASKEDLSSTDDEPDRPSSSPLAVTSTVRKNRPRVDTSSRAPPKHVNHDCPARPDAPSSRAHRSPPGAFNDLQGRRCGTLPNRRPRVASRPLHKSSEDVLDGEQTRPLQRTCASTVDVRDEGLCELRVDVGDEVVGQRAIPLYLMDATDVIVRAQLERARRGRGQEQFARPLRTRHNSLESEDDGRDFQRDSFATLPRRASSAKDQALSDPVRRLSGNVPVLEPLYEHAVSDPVKPRTKDNVIPWWELATRKYRHRSCPSLQAHVVSAFEQSLSNMTQRLQQLTATAEKKDSELQELRETIERLRKQSAEAGLNNGPSNGRRHTLGDSDGTTGCTGNSNHQGASMARQLSADSVTSLNSLSSACSASSHHKKKGWLRSSFSKAFSRSRKNRHGSVSDAEDCKDGPGGELSAPNSPRLPTAAKHEGSRGQGVRSHSQKSPEHENPLTGSKSSSALYKKEDEDVDELKKQLREKDLVLTDIRLEALSSAHQLESLKDTVIKMRNEMLNLKQNNERLQRLVTSKSLTSSQSSLPSDPDRRFSMTEVASTVAALANGDNGSNADQLEDLNVPEHPVVPSATSTTTEPVMEQDTDGKRINVAVYLGSEKNFNCNLISGNNSDNCVGEPPHCVIASVCISNKTTWDALDSTVRRCFKEYVSRVDPVTNLGLGVECLAAYHLGEASRCTTDSQHPELLPCGYLIGHVKTIYLVLSGYSWLAVDTLIPRSIVQRLISLLTEHRRVILCGPSGTGKSYLAGKLAHALVDADNEVKDAAAVATFNVDHKSSKELRQYLAHIAERCDSNAADELPRVIILENLQHAASLGELFSGLLGTRHSSCPAIIGTMSQATCSTTNLQLHHNFRWVLCANHMEPVKGFLGRYLRRKLLEHELRESGGARNAEMAAVVEWLPRVWQHLNKFLETHSSSDVTIGPRLFLSCPMEVAGSQVWFTDLWNYSVIPYLVEAVREGLTLYGRRVSGNGNGESTWEDPAQFITSSYPWISTHAVHGGSEALLRLRPEDVGYDVVTSGHTSGVGASSVKSLGSTHSDTEGDPLLNMLMRLQEAANYSSPHSNDSDSVTSLDSSHTRHSEDLSSSTSSSRGVESAL